jgi:hypothetical protein
MVPLVILLAFFFLTYRKKQRQQKGRGGGLSSWQFAKGDSPETPLKDRIFDEVDSGLAQPSPNSSNSPNTDTLSPPASTPSPKQGSSPPASTLSSRGSNKRRSYDKVYRTREPLPGKPNVEFENKVWDLDEETESSWTPSPNNSGTFRSSILSTPMQSPRSSQLPPAQPSTSNYMPVYEEPISMPPPKRQTLV